MNSSVSVENANCVNDSQDSQTAKKPPLLISSVAVSSVLHAIVLAILLSIPVAEVVKPLRVDLYKNIINEPEPVRIATIEPEVAAASPNPDLKDPGSEDVPESPKDKEIKPEGEAAAPPKTAPEPKPEKPKVEKPKPEPKPEPKPKPEPAPAQPKPEVQPVAVATEGDSPATVSADTGTDDDAEGAIKGPASKNGVVGGIGEVGSQGTSLTANGTKVKHGNGVGGQGVSKGALRAGYLQLLIPQITREYFYPKMAMRMGLEGRVLVAITIDSEGTILNVAIYKPSPHDILNDAALTSLRRLRKLPKPPGGLLSGGKMRVIVPMVYSIK